MANQQIDNIEDINEAINPITPPINGQEGLEMLGHNRNQPVILSRISRSFFKIYSHLCSLYLSIKNLGEDKLDKIDIWKIAFKEIPYNSDLNDYKTPGRYKQYQNQNVSGILNCPNAMAFTLEVVSIGGGWSTQTFTTYTSERVYIRSYNDSSWSKWYEFYTTKNFNPDTKEEAFSKKSGFNLDKTDLTENNSNKVFTAKGALDLKNWLVTNYTTLMNNIKSVLDNDIATKLSHGGYGQTAQQLKNEIDEAPQKIKWINIPSGSDLNDYKITGRYRIYDNGQALNSPTGHAFNLDVLSVGGAWITQMLTTYVGRSYMRFYNPGDKTWSAWGENYTNLTLPRSSSIISASENDVATSKAIKILNDNKFDKTGGSISGSINVGGAGKFYETYVKKYLYIHDYYDGPQTAKIWFNKENSSFPSNSLFYDDISDLYVGRSKVLNQRNSGISKEVLFSGTANKTANSILTKPITDYDLIYFYSGDGGDRSPNIFLPEDMMNGIGSRGIFQIRYFDSNGGDSSNDAQWDAGYFKMYSSTELRFMYDYSGRLYVPDGSAKDVRIVGIKFNFGNR